MFYLFFHDHCFTGCNRQVVWLKKLHWLINLQLIPLNQNFDVSLRPTACNIHLYRMNSQESLSVLGCILHVKIHVRRSKTQCKIFYRTSAELCKSCLLKTGWIKPTSISRPHKGYPHPHGNFLLKYTFKR